MGITNAIEFEKYHQISEQANSSKKHNRPWTIICKKKKKKKKSFVKLPNLTKLKDKQKILKYSKCLKDTGTFTYEDFCKGTMDFKKLWNKVLEYFRQIKFAYLNYRSIVVQEHGKDRTIR